MMANKKLSLQSIEEDILIFPPILLHPLRYFKNKNNISYGFGLKLKWGLMSLMDFILSVIFLIPVVKTIALIFSNKRIKYSYKIIKQSEAVFVKGGGFIHTYGGLISLYIIYYFLYHIILSLSLGKKVYIMPNSFGPFKGPFVKMLVKIVLSKCKIITARESISAKMLKEYLGINVKVYPDLAFHLEKTDRDIVIKKLNKFGIPIFNKKCIAITVRPYRFPNSDNPKLAYESYKKELAIFIKWLSENGFFPVLIEHTYSDSTHEQDMRCVIEIKSLLKETNCMVFSDLTLNCKKLKSVYSCFNYVIGTRFHSVIFSLSENIPSIAITYGGNKGQGIMKDIGLEEYAIDISEMSFEELLKRFRNLLDNENNIKLKIQDYLKKCKSSRQELINDIKLYTTFVGE